MDRAPLGIGSAVIDRILTAAANFHCRVKSREKSSYIRLTHSRQIGLLNHACKICGWCQVRLSYAVVLIRPNIPRAGTLVSIFIRGEYGG
jgi:hypothetical protein